MSELLGVVAACWTYPVKSLQGRRRRELAIGARGVDGDRRWGVIDEGTGHLLTAKRHRRLLEAAADDDGITLPGAAPIPYGDRDVHRALSEWLGRPVRLARPAEGVSVSYEMTFDPPDDTAELFEIPAPSGSFVDLAPVHLLSRATLEGARRLRADLDWDVRRFRPNLVIERDGTAFEENGWVGGWLHVGPEVVLSVTSPTVRCAMPLRAQPALDGDPALAREAGLFGAMSALNATFPNHLGVYAEVVRGGTVSVGDEARLAPPG